MFGPGARHADAGFLAGHLHGGPELVHVPIDRLFGDGHGGGRSLFHQLGVVHRCGNEVQRVHGRGHIVGAKNIPYDELDEGMSKLERFKSKPIVAVCDAGMTSSRVVASLRKGGLVNVYGLKGGITAWSQASLPLVSARKTKSKS